MAETIDEILNGSDEPGQVQDTQQQVDDEGHDDNQPTGEDGAQVAAENNNQADDLQQQSPVQAELSALAKERERIRQKEATLDAELARIKDQSGQKPEGDAPDQQQQSQNQSLKELNKQYREALSASLIDPSDEDAAKLVEDLEDKIETARINLAAQAQKSVSKQEKATTDFNEVHDAVHTEYPFLHPDHPQADAGLNADINAFYQGLLSRGESKAVALRKAVDTFAPSQAKKLGLVTAPTPQKQKQPTPPANTAAREKLKGGFSEVPSTGSASRTSKPFTGPTPMEDILGRSTT